MADIKIGIIIGSLRKAAWTRKIAEQLIEMAPAGVSMKIIEIGKLPFYNEDEETASPPASWTEFRKEVQSVDGIIFVTPEYNRSMTGALKNAIDVGSRPYGKSVWNNKPCAIISSSVGAIGGFGANHHLRQSLVTLNAPCLQSETYLSFVNKLFNDSGKFADEKTADFVRGFAKSSAAWVEKFAAQ